MAQLLIAEGYSDPMVRAGQKIRDYQTMEMSQVFMLNQNTWTTQEWLIRYFEMQNIAEGF